MKKFYFLFFFVIAIFMGCKNDEPTILLTSSDALKVNPINANQTLAITTNSDWTAKSNVSWCTLSDSIGTGNNSIVILCQNNLTVNPRIAKISIQAGDQTKSIVVTQSGGQSLMDDDFLDNSKGWNLMYNDTVSTIISNGFFNIKNTCKNTLFLYSKSIVTNFAGNYTISAKYNVVSGTLPFGLLFGFKDIQNFYILFVYPSGRCLVLKKENNLYSTITNNIITYTTQNTVKLIKIGANCEVYLNNLKINNFDYSNPFGSGVGFYSNPQTEISVDNIKVIQF